MSKIRKIYLLFIMISVVITSYGVYTRMDLEKDYDRYETVIGLQDLKYFASEEDRPLIEVAREFLDAGIHTVVVDESSIESLKQSEEYKLSVTYRGLDLHLHADRQLLEFIENGLRAKLKDARRISYLDDRTLIVEGKLSDLVGVNVQNQAGLKISAIEKLGIGYPKEELVRLQEAGIRFVLRPIFHSKLQDGKKSIDFFFSNVAEFAPDQRYIIFGGSGVLGDEKEIEYLRQKMIEFRMLPVTVENAQQDGNFSGGGLKALVKSMDFQTIRLFSTWAFIQNRYDYGIPGHHEGQEIINTYYRAISERNIRIIYFRFFLTPQNENVTNMEIYRQRFAELEDRLYRNYGIMPVVKNGVYTPPVSMKTLALSKKIKIFAIFGTIIAYLLLAEVFIGRKGQNRYAKTRHAKISYMKIRYLLWMSSFLVLTGAAALYGTKVEQMFALLASIAFPTLSVVYLMEKIKSSSVSGGASSEKRSTGDRRSARGASIYRSYAKGVWRLFVCMMISAVGALFVVTLYAHSSYLYEFSKFVGVKASQMVPLLAVVILYIAIIGIRFKTGRERAASESGDSASSSVLPESALPESASFDAPIVASGSSSAPSVEFSSVSAASAGSSSVSEPMTVIDQVKVILKQEVKVWQILLAGAVFGFLGVMLLRSGHTSNVEPPSFELWFRNFLELITPARPRTKAIFLGFPALILLVILADKQRFKLSYPLFLLAATIGQANLVNSFSHIRTPISVSCYRVLGEFVVSAFFVLVLVILFDIGVRVYQRISKHA